MAENLNQTGLTAVAEDVEYFRGWWEHSLVVADNATIRHGSAALRRLLVEDVAGTAWRQSGFEKSPTLQGPDLLAFLMKEGIDVSLVASAVAAGVRFSGTDWAFINAHRVDNPETGVPATAEQGFAVESGAVLRDTRNPTPSELDTVVNRTWRLHEYLDAPGIIRLGQKVSRREVILSIWQMTWAASMSGKIAPLVFVNFYREPRRAYLSKRRTVRLCVPTLSKSLQ